MVLGDTERKSVPFVLLERHEPKHDIDLFIVDQPPATCAAGIAVLSTGGISESEEREGRAFRARDMDTRQQDGELYALRSAVWLAETKTSLPFVRALCLLYMLYQGMSIRPYLFCLHIYECDLRRLLSAMPTPRAHSSPRARATPATTPSSRSSSSQIPSQSLRK